MPRTLVLPLFTLIPALVVTSWLKCHLLILDSQIYLSSLVLAPQLQTCTSYSLFDIYIWMSNEYLKLICSNVSSDPKPQSSSLYNLPHLSKGELYPFKSCSGKKKKILVFFLHVTHLSHQQILLTPQSKSVWSLITSHFYSYYSHSCLAQQFNLTEL